MAKVMVCPMRAANRRRVVEFVKLGGKRLFLPVIGGGCVIATIIGFDVNGMIRTISDAGCRADIDPCALPFFAIPGIA